MVVHCTGFAVLCLSKVLSKQGVISVICEDLNQFHSSADLCVAVTVMLHDRVWYIWITIKSRAVACLGWWHIFRFIKRLMKGKFDVYVL